MYFFLFLSGLLNKSFSLTFESYTKLFHSSCYISTLGKQKFFQLALI